MFRQHGNFWLFQLQKQMCEDAKLKYVNKVLKVNRSRKVFSRVGRVSNVPSRQE